MPEVTVPGPVRDTSFFLISYPHTEHNGQGRDREPDEWVIKFYRDLGRNVEELAAVPPSTRVGVLDRELWVENDWLAGLPEALASCRVLVPLYSPRYFQSDACGKEWCAFASRLANGSTQGTQAPAIVPVMWIPMTPGSIHQAARTVPIEYGGLDSYAERGLDGVIKLGRYREDYDKVVRAVARRVIATAMRSSAGPWPVADFDSLPNLFAPVAAPGPGAARLLVTVVAPHQGDLPAERSDRQYYGTAPWDWSPYRPTWEQPIAEYAANFARSMGFPPYVSVLREREEELLADGSAAHPELLIIDPWAVTSPECQALLARFNLAAKPWVQVVIPWNPADGETVAAEGRLRSALENALRRKLELGRVTAEIAVEGVPSLETFGAVLPALILAAAKRYLGHAAATPPDGQVVEMPRLHGFTPDSLHLLERTDA